eukprot:2860298-Alexandrium_andersonii.AAC.1
MWARLVGVRRSVRTGLKHKAIAVSLEERPIVEPDLESLLSDLPSVPEGNYGRRLLVVPWGLVGGSADPDITCLRAPSLS